MAREKATDTRSRAWTAIVYPDSAPADWRDLLDAQFMPWVESPLHDKDVNPVTGEIKKAHWHILLYFEGKKSFEQVNSILEPLGCPIPQRCHSMTGAVRYFTHMDNPEKHQYSPSDVIGHCGYDVAAALQPTSSRRYELIAEMLDYVRDQRITELQDLIDFAISNRFDDWFTLLCDNSAYIVNQYIKSQRCRSAASSSS